VAQRIVGAARTVKAKSDMAGLTDLLLEGLLEAGGGVASSVTDSLVALSANTTDDEWADYLKPLVGNALKFLGKKAGKQGLRHFAIAWNGHSYGESLARVAKKKLTGK